MSTYPSFQPTPSPYGQPQSVPVPPKPADLYPEGNTTGRVRSCSFGVNDRTGTMFCEITFDVQGLDKTATLWLSPRAIDRTKEILNFLGWNKSVRSPALSYQHPVPLRCTHEEYKGRWREKWWIEMNKPIEQSVIADFASALGVTLEEAMSSGAPSAPVTQPAPQPASPPPPPPPPAPPPQPAPPSDPFPPEKWHTRESVWAEVCKRITDPAQASKEYLDAIRKVEEGTGINNLGFGYNEWGLVLDQIVPF